MRVICCRCDKWLETVPGPATISHGLCEPCANELMRDLDATASVTHQGVLQRSTANRELQPLRKTA